MHQSTSEAHKFIHALLTIPGVGRASVRRIMERFGTGDAAWRADEHELAEAGLQKNTIHAILSQRHRIDPDRLFAALLRTNIWTVAKDDDAYPPLLKQIYDPPPLLYGRGTLPDWNISTRHCIGVVGTRKPTEYGRRAAALFTQEIASAGHIVVSGLAIGIDAIAHETALEHNGITIGILGSGVDGSSIYPAHHASLAARIANATGAVISEYPPGTRAATHHFPERNRNIAGISRGVLVVEAGEKSGALITARSALEENRDVCAVPGSIFSRESNGANGLIKSGAALVATPEDMFNALGIAYTTLESANRSAGYAPTEEEKKLLASLASPSTINMLAQSSGMPIHTIAAAISKLELSGHVMHLGGNLYQASSE